MTTRPEMRAMGNPRVAYESWLAINYVPAEDHEELRIRLNQIERQTQHNVVTKLLAAIGPDWVGSRDDVVALIKSVDQTCTCRRDDTIPNPDFEHAYSCPKGQA